jgi:ABC-type hemin transport system ATPase subunit
MKGSKVMAEDYAQVVDVLHDAALAIDASDDLIMTHPREVHCPDRFRRKNISRPALA